MDVDVAYHKSISQYHNRIEHVAHVVFLASGEKPDTQNKTIKHTNKTIANKQNNSKQTNEHEE